jgi:hypothetical protein
MGIFVFRGVPRDVSVEEAAQLKIQEIREEAERRVQILFPGQMLATAIPAGLVLIRANILTTLATILEGTIPQEKIAALLQEAMASSMGTIDVARANDINSRAGPIWAASAIAETQVDNIANDPLLTEEEKFTQIMAVQPIWPE